MESFNKSKLRRSTGKSSATTSSTGRQSPAVLAVAPPQSHWKSQSIAFREAIRAARRISKAEAEAKRTGVPLLSLLPAPTRSEQLASEAAYADYLTCPTCGRRFNQSAGERHIPQCKNIINKPSRLNKGSGKVATSYSYR